MKWVRRLLADLRVHRIGDANSGGGVINSIPQKFIFENNLLLSIDGSIGTSHASCPGVPIHCAGNWVTNEGASWVRIAGIPVNKQNDSDTCTHSRISGSSFIFIRV